MSIFARWIAVGAASVLLLPLGVLTVKWPFTQERTRHSLEHFTSSEVQFAGFSPTYFPYPGYVARHVTFSRRLKGRSVQLASLEELDCKGSWAAMLSLTRHAKELDVRGLQVKIPAVVPPAMKLHPELKEHVTISRVEADGTVLDVESRRGGERSHRFSFPKLTVANIGAHTPMRLDTVMRNPEPAGDLAVKASIGPFSAARVAQTALSGTFDFRHADLSAFHAIGGMLASQGRFEGTVRRCEIQGHAHIPDFEVASGNHAIDLTADFSTTLDAQHGDVSIESVAAHFLNTTVSAEGRIENTRGGAGKTASLELRSERARIEDLLRLFVKADPPPVEGPIGFQARVELPPGKEEFLRKVHLDGQFALVRAEFVKPETQAKVDELSNRARNGKRPKGVEIHQAPSDVKAAVRLQNGRAAFSDLYFSTPGATARGAGSYDLISQKIDLSGKLAIEATLSKAAGGIKSVLLMPMNPFFKKGTGGAVLPIRISGNYSHPIFRISLKKK